MCKPVLKWAGGKRIIIDLINDRLSKVAGDNTLFDVFAGGGSVALQCGKSFEKVVINDTNDELINMYKVIKTKSKDLIDNLEEMKNKHSKTFYYQVREWDRKKTFSKKTDVQKAARTIYLNRTCFNGLYRVNLKGQFNVPIGRYKNPRINDFENIIKVSKFLNNNVDIYNNDFSFVLKMAQKGDVVYLDPPYDKETLTSFIAYTREGFNRHDQERLKWMVDELTEKGVYVVLSNSATNFILELYKDYIKEDSLIKVRRSVGAQSKTRKKASEILIDNFHLI